MQFFSGIRTPDRPTPNTCFLLYDNWDDYSFKTTHVLFYYNDQAQETRLESVKVMSKGMKSPSSVVIPKTFSQLNDEFCSLGQGQSYYEEMMGLDEEIRHEILTGLRDCVHNPSIYEEFKSEDAFETSLLRTVDSSSVTGLYHSILRGIVVLTPYNFSFSLQCNDSVELSINVKPNSYPSSNLHVLIGRNGVGKTRLLAGIAEAAAEASSDDEYALGGLLQFSDASSEFLNDAPTNSFANLITMAFSAFDGFKPIETSAVWGDIKYEYVGLKQAENPELFLSPSDLRNDFHAALDRCLDSQKRKRWVDAIRTLSSDPVFREYELLIELESNADYMTRITDIFEKLSSGHKIVLLSITKLVDLVDEKTLLLIDEPENHLHPPLLSSFMRAVSDLLIKRNGVALVATHSPVVLQEVPGACVHIMDKVRSEYSFSRPESETFAENVGTLTREIFKLEVTESGFHKLLSDDAKNLSYEEILEKYNNQLGAEGRMIARMLSSHNDA